MKGVWKSSKERFTSGEDYILGKYRVGGVHYDGLRSKGDPKCYKAMLLLPGMKSNLGNFENAQDAKDIVELATALWLTNIGVSA